MHRLFQVDINEIHIRRATIEYKKLDKYYHYRPESDGTPFISKVEDKLIVSNVEDKLSVRQ